MKCNLFWMFVRFLSILRDRFLPRPFEAIALKGKHNLKGIEIGVYKGDHALSLFRYADVQKLLLVDPYKAYTDYNQQEMDEAKRIAKRRLRRKPVTWMLDDSDNVSKNLIQYGWDFVYIDGNHDYINVSRDIDCWWDFVKSGGIFGGHDFFNGSCAEHDGVIQAVTEYVVKNKLKLYVQSPDWWIIKP